MVVSSSKKVAPKSEVPKEDSASETPISPLIVPSTIEPSTKSESSTPARPDVALEDPNGPDSATENAAKATKTARQALRGADDSDSASPASPEKGKVAVPHDDPNMVFVGLRVYTHKDVPASVVGELRTELDDSPKPDADKATS